MECVLIIYQAQQLTTSLGAQIELRQSAFDERFAKTFKLAGKACKTSTSKSVACSKEGHLTPEALETAQVV